MLMIYGNHNPALAETVLESYIQPGDAPYFDVSPQAEFRRSGIAVRPEYHFHCLLETYWQTGDFWYLTVCNVDAGDRDELLADNGRSSSVRFCERKRYALFVDCPVQGPLLPKWNWLKTDSVDAVRLVRTDSHGQGGYDAEAMEQKRCNTPLHWAIQRFCESSSGPPM